MAALSDQNLAARAWRLARRQHWVIAHRQLLEIGFTAKAIEHRLATGRLHLVHRGVYAVGRPNLTREGRWMAAVLACGSGAMLSHDSAAALWGLRDRERLIHVSIPADRRVRRSGLAVHRRHPGVFADLTECDRIPVTNPARTLIDLACALSEPKIETLVSQADKLELIDPEALRQAVDQRSGERGARPLRRVLDRATFTLTDSELERRFIPIARRAGLPQPETGAVVNAFRVDFYWPELGLVVETDGLRYHRTPAQQARDRLRDQTHVAAGLEPLRFTHSQIRYQPDHVERVLRTLVARLRAKR